MFKNRFSFRPVLCLAASALMLAVALPAQAKMYKWTDENGQMHFGDRIPAKYATKEHEELNEQGVTVKVTEAAKTKEQLLEEKRQERERKKQEQARRKQEQRDRVLLDTYTTERDLVVARDSRLDAVDSQIKLSKSIIDDSEKSLKSLQAQVDNIKASNREVPQDLYRRIEIEQKQIEVQTDVMKKHKKRRAEIAEQFNGYIERFKVLKAEQKAKRDRLAKERGLQ